MPLKKKGAVEKSSKKRARSAKPAVKKRGSKSGKAKPGRKTAQQSKETQQLLENQVQQVLAELKQLADKRVLEDMSKRYGRHLASRCRTSRRSPGRSAAITNSPRRFGRPVGMKRECLLRLSTNRRWLLRRKWIAGSATSTTGASVTRYVSTCSTAHHTRGAKSRGGANRTRSL